MPEQKNELYDLSAELEASHGREVTHHDDLGVLLDEVNRLAEHPYVEDGVEYVVGHVEQPVELEGKEARHVKELAEEVGRGFKELTDLNLPIKELQETPQWTQIFKTLDSYNASVANVLWGELSPRDIDSILHTVLSINTIDQSLQFGHFFNVNLDTLIATSAIPDEVFKNQYNYINPNSQSNHSFIQDYISTTGLGQVSVYDKKVILSKVYGDGVEFDKFKPGYDPLVDQLRKDMGKVDFAIFSMENIPKDFSDKEIKNYEDRTFNKMDRILRDELGLSDAFINRFYYSAQSRMTTSGKEGDVRSSYSDGSYIKDRLQKIANIMKIFQPETIDYLAEYMGVVNLDRYNVDDLLNIYDLEGDEQDSIDSREYLKGGDVTVIFCDAFGDYNGAFDSMADIYRGKSKRTLLFEISSPAEIYRRMTILKRLGIQPTNIVIAAHGSPGSTGFGQWGGNRFQLVSDRALVSEEPSVVLDDANLARLFSDEFMKSDEFGKRKIIINSCSSAVEKDTMRSVAESILEKINRQDTLVYASNAVSTTRGDIDYGIKFINFEKPKSSLVEFSLDKRRHKKIRQRTLKILRLNERKQA